MPVDKSLITQIPLFQNLSPNAQELLASVSQARRFAALDLVLSHHTQLAFLILVLRGQLQKTEVSEDGRITGVGFTRQGEVLDWPSVIDSQPVIFSVNATKETDLLLVPINIARQLLKENPLLANHVMQLLTLDLRRNTEQRQLLTLPNAFQRICVQIVHLAEQGSPSQPSSLPKQHEIAAMVNTSRETVSRTIQMLVKNGILSKNGNRFVVARADQLKQIASTSNYNPNPAKQPTTPIRPALTNI